MSDNIVIVATLDPQSTNKRRRIRLDYKKREGTFFIRNINLSAEEFSAIAVAFMKNTIRKGGTKLARKLKELKNA